MTSTQPTPTREEIEADPLAAAFLAAFFAAAAEEGDTIGLDMLDDQENAASIGRMVRHLRAQGVEVQAR